MSNKSKTVKLVIEIPEEDLAKIKDGHIPFNILNVMKNAVPLDENMCSQSVIPCNTRRT